MIIGKLSKVRAYKPQIYLDCILVAALYNILFFLLLAANLMSRERDLTFLQDRPIS